MDETEKMKCEKCGIEADAEHGHCEYCEKPISKGTAHTVPGADEEGVKHYCCGTCCDDHGKAGKDTKAGEECRFC